MIPRPFDPPLPSVESVKDVRLLAACCFCGRLGKSLLAVAWEIYRRRQRANRWAHAFCLVEASGWPALAALPEAELDKVSMSDLLGWGLTFAEFEKKIEASR